MKFKMLAALATCVIGIFCVSSVFAKPAMTVRTDYYNIEGTTAHELLSQMRRRGKNGRWGYARWYVRWSSGCRISVEITYTMPRWTNKKSAPVSLRKRWEKMLAALWKHERRHGRHGISAAREVEKSGCRGDNRTITRKWAQQDRVYDARTRHGRTQGVSF